MKSYMKVEQVISSEGFVRLDMTEHEARMLLDTTKETIANIQGNRPAVYSVSDKEVLAKFADALSASVTSISKELRGDE